MIHYLTHPQIDKQKWDDAIRRSHNKLPLALSKYLDLLSPGWDALISEDYTKVMPLTWRKKFGLRYLCQPIICQQLGVFSTTDPGVFCVDDFIEAIPVGFRLIEINFNSKNYVSGKIRVDNRTEKTSQFLPLETGYEVVRSRYSGSHVRNMEKFSPMAGGLIHTTLSCSDFNYYKQAAFKTMGVRLSSWQKEHYLRFLRSLDQTEDLRIFCVQNENQQITGSICIIGLDLDTFTLQTFCTDEGRKSGVIFYMLDSIIKDLSAKKGTLDFMGSSIPGIRERNLGFGSQETTYTSIKINRLGWFLRILKK